MKRIYFALMVMAGVLIFLSSCSRGITPYEAANGKAKCKRHVN